MLIAGDGRLSSRIGMTGRLLRSESSASMPILDEPPASTCYQHLNNIALPYT
jgi:hypothetical protein